MNLSFYVVCCYKKINLMRIIYLLFFCAALTACVSSKNKTPLATMTNIEKWKKAVVHLECATNSIGYKESAEAYHKIIQLHLSKQISDEEYFRLVNENSKSRDIRYQGTAIFLKKGNKRYLLTARHVLWDELNASREVTSRQKVNSIFPQQQDETTLAHAQDIIFNIIFRVLSLDEFSSRSTNEFRFTEPLMNLGAGGTEFRPYTFSKPDFDLAIISLDNRQGDFADELLSAGYVPIDFSDIVTGPIQEGEDIMAVGFPGATALVGQISLNSGEQNWSSNAISTPIFSFGKVSMLNKNLNFFWTDLSIYPGNSGGPVVSNNKLVGIVSAQAYIPVEGGTNMFTRIPFGKIIKAEYIFDLIKAQEQKDSDFGDFVNGRNKP